MHVPEKGSFQAIGKDDAKKWDGCIDKAELTKGFSSQL